MCDMFFYIVSSSLAFLLSITSAAWVVWRKKPALVLQGATWLALRRCGLRTRYVLGDSDNGGPGLVFCYAERGERRRSGHSTVVFVHGFSSSKDNWVPIIQSLPKEWHIVAVDLPGHGNTSIPSDTDEVSVHAMTKWLHELLTAAKINSRRMHLIGTSLGGAVVGLYASQHPNEVERLTVICPAVTTPVKSRFMREVKQGTNNLLPSTEDEFRNMFNALIYHKERAPQNSQILKGVMQMRQTNAEFLQRLFNSVAEKADSVKAEETRRDFSRIYAPTQIIWGENDEMVDISGADMLRQLLPNCRRVDIIAECGHAVVWDQPETVAKLLQSFRQENPQTLSTTSN